jgi:hypothetical protein
MLPFGCFKNSGITFTESNIFENFWVRTLAQKKALLTAIFQRYLHSVSFRSVRGSDAMQRGTGSLSST